MSLGWEAFGFATGGFFPSSIGPFFTLHEADKSCSIDSFDKSMYSTMPVSAGRQAKLILFLTLEVRPYSGRVISDATVDIYDGYGNRGIHYYLLP